MWNLFVAASQEEIDDDLECCEEGAQQVGDGEMLSLWYYTISIMHHINTFMF